MPAYKGYSFEVCTSLIHGSSNTSNINCRNCVSKTTSKAARQLVPLARQRLEHLLRIQASLVNQVQIPQDRTRYLVAEALLVPLILQHLLQTLRVRLAVSARAPIRVHRVEGCSIVQLLVSLKTNSNLVPSVHLDNPSSSSSHSSHNHSNSHNSNSSSLLEVVCSAPLVRLRANRHFRDLVSILAFLHSSCPQSHLRCIGATNTSTFGSSTQQPASGGSIFGQTQPQQGTAAFSGFGSSPSCCN